MAVLSISRPSVVQLKMQVNMRSLSINFKDGKATGNVGFSGTGLSYRERLDNPGSDGSGKGGAVGWVVWLAIAIVLLGVFFGR